MSGSLTAVILVMAAATVLSRVAPFLFLGRHAERPWVRYLGRGVPPVIVTLLVIYCLRGVRIDAWPNGLPELGALVVTVGLHLAWGNALISIAAGTGLYMFLQQSGLLI